jgi:CRISPR-associated endonuclease Csn1
MYSIGLDLGISSVGWSVIDERTGNVIDLGVRLFSAKK